MKTVVGDPGHGKEDPGALGQIWDEKEITLGVGLEFKKQLEANHFNILMTRTADVDVPLLERQAVGKQAHAFCSIHVNDFHNTAVGGTEIWYQQGDESSRNYAQAMLAAIMAAFPTLNNRGLKEGSVATRTNWYTFDNGPSDILVELGFINNDHDSALLDAQNWPTWGEALMVGTRAHLGYQISPALTDLDKRLEMEALTERLIQAHGRYAKVVRDLELELWEIRQREGSSD